jgi:putative redox protein
VVTGRRPKDLVAAIRAGNFEIISGLLPEQGGADEGPDPHRLLEASLAACTILTVQMYANRKGWPLESANVNVNIRSESASGTTIARTISFSGQLDDEQKKRLFEIANKCPIHRLLIGTVVVESVLDAEAARI